MVAAIFAKAFLRLAAKEGRQDASTQLDQAYGRSGDDHTKFKLPAGKSQ